MKRIMPLSLVLASIAAFAIVGRSADPARLNKLGQMKLDEVSPAEGFAYLSGYYDTNRVPTDFVTMYCYKNLGEAWKVKITGNKLDLDMPVSKIDDALLIYKALVLKRATADEVESEQLIRKLQESFKDDKEMLPTINLIRKMLTGK